jgi:hypothetical protein
MHDFFSEKHCPHESGSSMIGRGSFVLCCLGTRIGLSLNKHLPPNFCSSMHPVRSLGSACLSSLQLGRTVMQCTCLRFKLACHLSADPIPPHGMPNTAAASQHIKERTNAPLAGMLSAGPCAVRCWWSLERAAANASSPDRDLKKMRVGVARSGSQKNEGRSA